MRLRNLLVHLVISMLLTAILFGQTAATLNKESGRNVPGDVKSGAVVEAVTKESAADRAGIQTDDILVNWSRGDASGNIETPLDISLIEIEQKPRGPMTVHGLRGAEKKSWTLGPEAWGIQARPNFQDSLLTVYRESQQLSTDEKLAEAAEGWRLIAKRSEGSARAWALAHAGDSFAKRRQWKEADDAYQEAIERAKGSGLTSTAPLLQAWAQTFDQRSDWANAEKYYQQSIAESQKLARENLLMAMSLSSLGAIALKKGDLAKAQEYNNQSLDISRKLAPESLDVAQGLNGLGDVAMEQGDSAKAKEYYDQTLIIREKLAPESLDVAQSLNGLGDVALDQGDLPKAEEYYGHALKIEQKLSPESVDVAATIKNLGEVNMVRGDLAKAEEYYRQSLEMQQKLAPGSLGAAGSFRGLGIIAWGRGDLVKAEEYYRQALAIRQRLAPGSLAAARSTAALGLVAWDRGDWAKSKEYLGKALVIYQKLAPGSLDAANIVNSLGVLAIDQEDWAKAEEYLTQALLVRQKLAPGTLELINSFGNLGDLALKRGDLVKAEEYSNQTLVIQQNLITQHKLAPGSLAVAGTITVAGNVAKERGDLVKAEEYYRRALEIEEKLAPESRSLAEVLASLAGIMRRKGQLDAAAQLYEQALNTLEGQNARLGGSQDVRSGFRARYVRYCQDYIDLLISQKQPEKAFNVLEQSHARVLLETLAAAHVDIHNGVDAELLAREKALQMKIADKSDLRAELLGEPDAANAKRLEAVNKEIAGLLSQYGDVEGQIRASSPGYAALNQPQPLSAKQVQQQLLDPETVLLEYSLGEKRSYVFAVTQTSVLTYELPKQVEIENSVRRVYELLTTPNIRPKGETADQRQERLARAEVEYWRAAARLSQMLLGPIAVQLSHTVRTNDGKQQTKSRRLLVVCDGALHYLPFSALPLPRQPRVPLIVEHEVVNLPSASVLALLRRQNALRNEPDFAVAVLADPVFDREDARVAGKPSKLNGDHRQSTVNRGTEEQTAEEFEVRGDDSLSQNQLTRSATDIALVSLPRLQWSREEAQSILATVPAGQGLLALDFVASRATVASPKLARYQIVHFATHGLLNSKHPELSGLVLSLVTQDGVPQNGFLGLHDIYNLNLPADLVVLSACQTALGKNIQGEGVVGLTRGFMYAGATRVVASLWEISDQATATLMVDFYKSMRQQEMRPAAALRAAQIRMWQQKRWSSPYYWGAFQIQGEWK